MLGFMTTAAFISMWISNIATVLMLLPIVDSVVEEVGRNRDSSEAQLSNKTLLYTTTIAINIIIIILLLLRV